MQSEPADTDTEGGGGGKESVRINGVSVWSGVEFRENLRAFFRQGRSVKRLFVITRCPY